LRKCPFSADAFATRWSLSLSLAACKSSRLFSRIVTQVCTTAPASLLFLQLSVSVGAWPSHISAAITQRCEALLSHYCHCEDKKKKTRRAQSEREREKALASVTTLVLFVCAALANQQTMRQKRDCEQLATPTDFFLPLCHFAGAFSAAIIAGVCAAAGYCIADFHERH
jgi:hypothetical protein